MKLLFAITISILFSISLMAEIQSIYCTTIDSPYLVFNWFNFERVDSGHYSLVTSTPSSYIIGDEGRSVIDHGNQLECLTNGVLANCKTNGDYYSGTNASIKTSTFREINEAGIIEEKTYINLNAWKWNDGSIDMGFNISYCTLISIP